MYRKIEDFERSWTYHSECTRKVFDKLTDESLPQSVLGGHRTLGRMAWHIVQTLSEMGNRTGLDIEGPGMDRPVPESADEIKKAYDDTASSVLLKVSSKWDDEDLLKKDDMYGEMWPRGMSLEALIHHEIHHRAQMTVLMRQAGLDVPGTFGPSKDEWKNYGTEAPEI